MKKLIWMAGAMLCAMMCFTASEAYGFEDIVSLDTAIGVLQGCKSALEFAPIPGIAGAVDVLLGLIGQIKVRSTRTAGYSP